MNRIALALTIAAISTGATAQSNKLTWNDLLTPYEAKTNPAVPIAPPPIRDPLIERQHRVLTGQAAAPAPMQVPRSATSSYEPKINNTPPETVSTGLLDACIIEAIGRLPKIDGLQVTNSSYEFDHSWVGDYREVWRVSVSVKLGDRQSQYSWYCHLDTRGEARLKTTSW